MQTNCHSFLVWLVLASVFQQIPWDWWGGDGLLLSVRLILCSCTSEMLFKMYEHGYLQLIPNILISSGCDTFLWSVLNVSLCQSSCKKIYLFLTSFRCLLNLSQMLLVFSLFVKLLLTFHLQNTIRNFPKLLFKVKRER